MIAGVTVLSFVLNSQFYISLVIAVNSLSNKIINEFHFYKLRNHSDKLRIYLSKPEFHTTKRGYRSVKPECNRMVFMYQGNKPEFHIPKLSFLLYKPECGANKPEFIFAIAECDGCFQWFFLFQLNPLYSLLLCIFFEQACIQKKNKKNYSAQ